MWISLKLFLEVGIERKSISETSTHFNRLFETPSSSRATAYKQTMQNIVMATVENTEFKSAEGVSLSVLLFFVKAI